MICIFKQQYNVIVITFLDDTKQVYVWHANEHRAEISQHSHNESSEENRTSWYGWHQSSKGIIYIIKTLLQ